MTYGKDWRSGFNSLPVAGSFFSSIWGDPAEEANAQAMAQAVQAYQQYRPENIHARMNTFQNMSNAFGPMNNLMSQMYGPGASIDMSKVVKNPFSDEYMKSIDSGAWKDQGPAAKAEKAKKDFKESKGGGESITIAGKPIVKYKTILGLLK